MTELLALVHIRDVNLDHRCLERTDTVLQSYRGVGVGASIQHNAVVAKANLLHLVNQFALYVALIVLDVDVGKALTQLRQVCVE